MTNYIFIACFLSLCIPLSAQSDSLLRGDLPAVTLTEDKLPYPGQDALFSSQKDIKQTLQASSTLAELLSFQTTAIVRDRGNNSLATMSIRGGSSQQTQVLWNGSNINNGMLGVSDLSTISPLFMETIEIKPVQREEVYQPIGGVLQLANSRIESNRLTVGAMGGQYGFQQYHMLASHTWSSQTQIRLKGLYSQNTQDFPYLDEHQSVLLPDRQPHAVQNQKSGMIEVIQGIGSSHRLEWRSWIKAMERQLPPSLRQRRSTAIQRDSFQRHQFIWKFDRKKYRHTLNYTYRRETNHFEDPLNALDSQNPFRAHQWISNHRYTLNPKLSISGGLNIQHQRFETKNYAESEEITEGELFIAVNAYPLGEKHRIEAQVRQAWRNDQSAPVTGQLAYTYFSRNHSARLEYSKSYRFPSANDLFWSPYGNPDLHPESSHQIQAQYTHKTNGVLWDQFRFASYYKLVKDWILWAPLNDNFFRPRNILEVTAAGVESSIRKSISLTPKIKASIRLLYNYQYVRNTGPNDSPVAEKGGNLIYMPEHQWAAYVSTSWRSFSLLYQHTFQSQIHTQANLQAELPARSIAHLTLSYSQKIKNQEIQCSLKVQNLWNEDYLFQPHVPAPGRFWRWGIFFTPKF